MFGFAISSTQPTSRFLRGECVFHIGELNHCYNLHVCVLTFLAKLKITQAFLQVFICLCLCGCALFNQIFYPLALALIVFFFFPKTLNVGGMCLYAWYMLGGIKKGVSAHSFHTDLRTYESDMRNVLT